MRAKKNKNENHIIKKILIIAIFIILVGIVINLAPNYIQNQLKDKTNVIINNNNVTTSLKFDAIVDENDAIYLSSKDIANFFDDNIYYDNVYGQIITTSDTKVATIKMDQKEMYINGSKVNIYATAFEKNDTFYLPISEMKNVYNVEVNYSKDSDIVTIDSLNKEQKKGNCSNDSSIKYKPTAFSKTLTKVKKGESVVIIDEKDGWYQVRTSDGIIGYLKDVVNIYNVRDNMEEEKQIDGKVSLVWDYYSEYASAPTRTEKIDGINVVSPTFVTLKKLGQGELDVNIGNAGKQYITWAHNNGYKVWPSVSNNSYQGPTAEILNDYKLREKLINNIIELTTSYDIDGINIDFENLGKDNKDAFSRFIIELAPRLKEYGKVLSVDVTAPDGSEDWSMCYNRYKIGQVADYIIFMGYDQYGVSSPKEGTTAGADWVEVSIKKFLGQEGVKEEKLILAMPFYTRLWKETNGEITSNVVSMKNIESVLPDNVEKKWDEDLKQYYVEYTSNGSTYKMWIEDETSLKAKFDLMNQYNLAGAAYWQKDFENSSIWNVIEEQINK